MSWCDYPKWRANATTAFRSFHKSEIGIAFPFKSNTLTVSNIFAVSSLTEPEDSIPVSSKTFNLVFLCVGEHAWEKKKRAKLAGRFRDCRGDDVAWPWGEFDCFVPLEWLYAWWLGGEGTCRGVIGECAESESAGRESCSERNRHDWGLTSLKEKVVTFLCDR